MASVFFGAGCNVWVNGDPIGDWPGKAGNAGSSAGGSGPGGQAGAGGTDNGEGGYAGSPGGAGKAGYAGAGGGGGPAGAGGYGGAGGGGGPAGAGGGGGPAGAGGGGPFPALERFSLVGGDVEEDRETFPFGVAIAPDGALFVSTLGNRDNEPSRIYRFAPGTSSSPEVLFEVGNGSDAAVYGLTFDNVGNLHACVSQHLDSSNNNIFASIFRFDPSQLDESFLGPANVVNTQLRSTAVNFGGNFFISDEVQAGRCGHLAFDGGSTIYAPDASGESGFLFRYNIDGDLQAPGGALGDVVSNSDLSRLAVTAWSSNPEFGPGGSFGVTGVTFSGNSVNFVREDDSLNIFSLTPIGLFPENGIESVSLALPLPTPFGLASLGQGQFLASSRDNNALVRLVPAGVGGLEATTLLDRNNDDSFLQPAGIAVGGNAIVVAASQIDQLGGVASAPAKLFSIQLTDL